MKKEYVEMRVTNRTITTEPIHKNIVKAIDRVETCINGVKSIQTSVVVTTLENVEAVVGLEAISTKIDAPKMFEGYACVCLISNDGYEAVMSAELPIGAAVEKFDDAKYKTNKYRLVLFNSGSQTIADLDGNFIPIPVHADYITACMSNEYYDLKGVLAAIQDDPHILNPEKLQILEIPSYNRTMWQSLYLDFYFIPDADVYEAAQQQDWPTRYMVEHTFDIQDCKYCED